MATTSNTLRLDQALESVLQNQPGFVATRIPWEEADRTKKAARRKDQERLTEAALAGNLEKVKQQIQTENSVSASFEILDWRSIPERK